MTFTKQFDETLERCKQKFHRLKILGNKMWGPSPTTILQIYKQCLRPIFEYRIVSGRAKRGCAIPVYHVTTKWHAQSHGEPPFFYEWRRCAKLSSRNLWIQWVSYQFLCETLGRKYSSWAPTSIWCDWFCCNVSVFFFSEKSWRCQHWVNVMKWRATSFSVSMEV